MKSKAKKRSKIVTELDELLEGYGPCPRADCNICAARYPVIKALKTVRRMVQNEERKRSPR